MGVRNWAGMEIDAGSIVWRGARDGNSSTFKIGRVRKVDPLKNTATVEWLFTEGYSWQYDKLDDVEKTYIPNIIRLYPSTGTCTVNSLVPLDVNTDHLENLVDCRTEAVKRREHDVDRRRSL